MSKEIKITIDELNAEFEEIITPGIFTLNKRIGEIKKEIEFLQNQCQHNYVNGICEFCRKEEASE